MKNFKPFSMLCLSVVIQAIGAIFTKYAALASGIEMTGFFYLLIIAGMAGQVFVWQYALKYYQLSFAYPFKSLVNFLIVFAAFWLFQEQITNNEIIGLFIITIGVFFISRDMDVI